MSKKEIIKILVGKGYNVIEAEKIAKDFVIKEAEEKKEEKSKKIRYIKNEYDQFLITLFSDGLTPYQAYEKVLKSSYLLTANVPDFSGFKTYISKNNIYQLQPGDHSHLAPFDAEIKEKMKEEGATAWSVYNFMCGRYGEATIGKYHTFRGHVRVANLKPDLHNEKFYTQHSRKKRGSKLDFYKEEIRKELVKTNGNCQEAHYNLTMRFGRKNIGNYTPFCTYVKNNALKDKGKTIPDNLYFHRAEIRRVLLKFEGNTAKAYNFLKSKLNDLLGSFEEFNQFVEKYKLKYSEATGQLLKEREVRQAMIKTIEAGKKVRIDNFKKEFGIGDETARRCYKQILEGYIETDIAEEEDFLSLHREEIKKEFRTGKYTSYTYVYTYFIGKYGEQNVGSYQNFYNFVKNNGLKARVAI